MQGYIGKHQDQTGWEKERNVSKIFGVSMGKKGVRQAG
jgi:hypothetical protein